MTIKKIEQQHSFFLQKFSLSHSPPHFKFHERESWSSSILLHYLSFTLFNLKRKKNVLHKFYGKNYHNRISIFFIFARYCNQGRTFFFIYFKT